MPRISRYTPLDQVPIVVLDSETTGLDVATCRLLQLSAVRVRDRAVQSDQVFDRFMNPGEPIPPQSTAIHGITDAMVADAPRFEDVAAEFAEFVGDSVLVGHNIGFDLAVLLRETQLAGGTWRTPQFLDTKLLAAALDPSAQELGLDALAGSLGISIANRHTALADAIATAEVLVQLLPKLIAAGVRTLGEAEARSNAQSRMRARHAAQGWYDTTSLQTPDAFESGRDAPALVRLDSFAYRYKVEDVMDGSPTILPPSTLLQEALRLMVEKDLNAILAGDAATGRVDGIITKSDALRAIAEAGPSALEHKLDRLMSAPIATIPPEALVYRALARMQRLGISHLPIADTSRRVVGLLSLRGLLLDEAAQAVGLGDRLSTASSPHALASARSELSGLVRRLLADEVPSAEVAAVIGAELRELLARAAVLAEKRMESEGAGRPSVAYALFALGGLARSESVLGSILKYGLVFASGAEDGDEARWFEAFASHLSDVLRAAGVQASSTLAATNPAWRRSLDAWQAEIARWTLDAEAAADLATRFFDFRFVHGDQDLADDLHTWALKVAAGASPLVRALSPKPRSPDADSKRLDLATDCLEPIEATARALAVAVGARSLATPERLADAESRTGLSRQTADELTEMHQQVLGILLQRQMQALDRGEALSLQADLDALDPTERAIVEAARSRTSHLDDVVRMALVLV